MKSVTMLEFRRNAEEILRRVARGERLVLSHRGKPMARLEPVTSAQGPDRETDRFLTIGDRATPSPKARTPHGDIDAILYGNA